MRHATGGANEASHWRC